MASEKVLAHLDAHRQEHVDQLCDFLRIPSISSQSEHKADVERACAFVADELRELGLTVEVIPTDGHPLVYAESEQRPDRRTLLFYGHYDVQPVDPLDLWTTPPFEPRVADGILYARGASDDKGQVYAHLKALEAYVRTGTELPVNVKFIIEGEEECGGHGIYRYTEQNPQKLACDAVVISDTTLYNETTPGICYSLKGMAYMEIRVKGPDMDLHSGSYGGTVQNPGNAIADDRRRPEGRATAAAWSPASTTTCWNWTRPSATASPPWATPTRSSRRRPARRRPPARRATPPSNACGPAPPATSTAWSRATAARAARPSSRPRPWPRCPCAWCRTRTRKRSPRRSPTTSRPSPRRASRWRC